jgi:hypothetical protein
MSVPSVSIPAGFLREWCTAHAEGTEQTPDAFLASGLALMATVCGPRLVIRWTKTYEERANLWVMVAARSALGGKTTTANALAWGIRRAKAELGDDSIRRMPIDRFSDADIVHELDVLGQDQRHAEAAEKRLAKAEGREPEPVSVSGRTPPVGFVIVVNELAQLWGGDIPKHHDQARTTLLSVYDGMLSSSTRATKVAPQECCVSAIGNIPISELERRTEISTLRSGFAGRWFMLPLPDPVDHIATPRVGGEDSLASVARNVDKLCELAKAAQDRVDVIAQMLTEGSDADIERDRWYRAARMKFLAETSEDELDQAGQELFQRLQSTALKLAVYSAISRDIHKAHNLSSVRINKADVQWGQVIVDISRETLVSAVRPTIGTTEDKILAALRNGLGATSRESACTVRELRRKVAKAMRSPDFMRVCSALEELGEVGLAEEPTAGRPRVMIWAAD